MTVDEKLMSNVFFAAGYKVGYAIGFRKGLVIGKAELIADGIETVSEAAMDIGITEEEFLRIAAENGFDLQ